MGTRGGGGSCAAARKCCDGKDPDCAVPSVSEEDASKRHGEKGRKAFASENCEDLSFPQNGLLSFSSSFILFYYDLLQCFVPYFPFFFIRLIPLPVPFFFLKNK